MVPLFHSPVGVLIHAGADHGVPTRLIVSPYCRASCMMSCSTGICHFMASVVSKFARLTSFGVSSNDHAGVGSDRSHDVMGTRMNDMAIP